MYTEVAWSHRSVILLVYMYAVVVELLQSVVLLVRGIKNIIRSHYQLYFSSTRIQK